MCGIECEGSGVEGRGSGGGQEAPTGRLELARDAIDRFKVGDGGGFRGGFEFLEFAGGGENAGFKGADGIVVIFHGTAKRATEFGEVIGEFAEAFVECSA